MTTGFSATEVGLLLTAILAAIGAPAGLQFRAMREDNKFLRDLLSEQLEIGREQNSVQKETAKVIRQRTR